ncbi:MAG: hypothetical protein CMP48_27940 [Rickettsiales bacterium]|nr:hypothetical protein [Rickettsiales bacterium]MBR11496.1 hypothetical protein [Rickettsiales bacterium]|tara:strand:+ start:354 stop:617 length:264 start_codon:yes stop_codon:yes gene_type:complete
MEINKMLISGEEHSILNDLLETYGNNAEWIKNEDDTYILKINDDDAEILSQKVKDKLVLEGFDQLYHITSEGKVYERLVDKFVEIGW